MENLTAFASNPEFVSVPAQISSEVGELATVVTLESLADSLPGRVNMES